MLMLESHAFMSWLKSHPAGQMRRPKAGCVAAVKEMMYSGMAALTFEEGQWRVTGNQRVDISAHMENDHVAMHNTAVL
ncbi:hypothetical protein ACWGTI_01020 [Mesorhizobium sp. ArgA1]